VPIGEVFGLLHAIGDFSNTYSLQEAPDAFALSIEVASELSRFRTPISQGEDDDEGDAVETPSAKRSSRAPAQRKRAPTIGVQDEHIQIWTEAYRVFGGLCSTVHGVVEFNTTAVLKTLLPNILMTFGGHHSGPAVPKLLQAIRQRAVEFARYNKSKQTAHDNNTSSDQLLKL